MTKKKWERIFLKNLKPLSQEERQKALEYYREMYGDKAESGLSEAEILANFGSPDACAMRVLLESFPEKEATVYALKEKFFNHSLGELIGLIFLIVILILPIAAVFASIIVAFGISSFACAIVAVATALGSLIFPIYAAGAGASAGGVLMYLGMGFAGTGVCILLAIGFYFTTKYCGIALIKALQYIYRRR